MRFCESEALWENLRGNIELLNILFVCSRNKWRSPTAEKVWHKVPGISVCSAGTSRKAQHRLTVSDLRWADMIFVMEDKHKSRIKADFRGETQFKKLHVLDIPDDYRYMDPELMEIVKEKTQALIYDDTL